MVEYGIYLLCVVMCLAVCPGFRCVLGLICKESVYS